MSSKDPLDSAIGSRNGPRDCLILRGEKDGRHCFGRSGGGWVTYAHVRVTTTMEGRVRPSAFRGAVAPVFGGGVER
jgi:hypothetical protein